MCSVTALSRRGVPPCDTPYVTDPWPPRGSLAVDCATPLFCFACRPPHWHTFGEIAGDVGSFRAPSNDPESPESQRDQRHLPVRPLHIPHGARPAPDRSATAPPTLPTVRSPGDPVPRRPSDRRIVDGSARRGPAFRAHRRSRAPGPTAARTRAPALTWWNTCAPTFQRDRTVRRPPLAGDPDADRPRHRDEGARTR